MFTGLSGIQLVFFLGALLIGMTTHEAMHAFAGHWLGDTTAKDMGRLTLNPLKHINLVTTIVLPFVMVLMGLPPIFAAQPVPFNPDRVRYDEFGVALIGLAGPLTNLALACLGGLVFRLGHFTTSTVSDLVVIFTLTNVALFTFNMIPFPPLDGSRVLYAFAPEPLQDIMRTIERFGFMAILLFFFVLYQFVGPTLSHINEAIVRFLLGV